MHRARLPGFEAGTADVVVFGCDALAAERDWRGGNAGDLARKPEQHDPRQTTTDGDHDRDQGNTLFAVMIE
jgi:hypothetical protein